MSSSPGDGRGVKKKNRMPRRYGEYAGRGCVIGVFGAGWGALFSKREAGVNSTHFEFLFRSPHSQSLYVLLPGSGGVTGEDERPVPGRDMDGETVAALPDAEFR